MSTQALTRRRLLFLMGAAGVAFSPFRIASAAGAACAGLTEGIDAAALEALGKEFRSRYPELANGGDVAALLTEADASPERLRTRMADDYRAGRTIELSGWRLSVTEGRLLLALSECSA